jgi:dihydropteroate synthase-like protein
MSEHLLFLTGTLAEPSLRRVLEGMQPSVFTYTVKDLGLKVAGLMTAEMILRRLDDAGGADRVMVPGLCRGNLDAVADALAVPVIRGPVDLKDMPEFFGHGATPPDLSRHDIQIFAEIVDAPQIPLEEIIERAHRLSAAGADVIDVGCLPDTPFPALADVVAALKAEGFRVSVDSMHPQELLAGGKAGADYLLSLHEETLWITDEVAAVAVLIPSVHGDMDSLERAMEAMDRRGRPYIADAILDPIPFGFLESLMRYRALRARHPDVEIMLGVGNLTELTEADSTGVNAILFGLASELRAGHVLTTQVSPHCRTAVREADVARRMMFAAREDNRLPKGLTGELLALHARSPFPYSPEEIADLAAQIRDPSYRVQISEEGIHVFNRDGMNTSTDPFGLFPALALDSDAGHAFYMGVELARAQIAWQLGKRYQQDRELEWGCTVERPAEDMDEYRTPGSTLLPESRRS